MEATYSLDDLIESFYIRAISDDENGKYSYNDPLHRYLEAWKKEKKYDHCPRENGAVHRVLEEEQNQKIIMLKVSEWQGHLTTLWILI